MPALWTDEDLLDELGKHCKFWQEKLRLRDVDLDLRISDSMGEGAWITVEIQSGGANPNKAWITVARPALTWLTAYDLWEAACHELLHVLLRPLKRAMDGLGSLLAPAMLTLLTDLHNKGNEDVVYKLEALFCAVYRFDAPKREEAQRPLPRPAQVSTID